MEAGEAFISSYSKKLAAIAQEDEARSYDEELRAQGIEPKKRRGNRSQTADVEHEQPHFSWVTFGRMRTTVHVCARACVWGGRGGGGDNTTLPQAPCMFTATNAPRHLPPTQAPS